MRGGRPARHPARQLLKARALTALRTVRSERLFCEPPGCNLLRLWFPGRELGEGGFDHSVFARNHQRAFSADAQRDAQPDARDSGQPKRQVGRARRPGWLRCLPAYGRQAGRRADCPERNGARQALQRAGGWCARRKLWVDGGHTGETFARWVRAHWPKLEVEVIQRPDAATGFAVLPRRWIVERAFGWLMRHRRLVRDCERTEAGAETWIHLAMIRIQLCRLA